MTTVKTTLAEIVAKPVSRTERARLAALAAEPDATIDFSDQEEITAGKIAAGHYRLIGRGGARPGAGRPALGKTRKTVKLSPAALRRLEAYRRRHGLPHFSAAIEHLALAR